MGLGFMHTRQESNEIAEKLVKVMEGTQEEIQMLTKRVEFLYDAVTELASTQATHKIIIMNLAKQVGVTPDILLEMKKLEKLKAEAKK